MKEYKALVNFSGQVSMSKNDVLPIKDDMAAPLLRCGYIEAMAEKEEEKKVEKKAKTNTRSTKAQTSNKNTETRKK